MVPEARRSPGRMLQPVTVWWTSCCFIVQYMNLHSSHSVTTLLLSLLTHLKLDLDTVVGWAVGGLMATSRSMLKVKLSECWR